MFCTAQVILQHNGMKLFLEEHYIFIKEWAFSCNFAVIKFSKKYEIGIFRELVNINKNAPSEMITTQVAQHP